MPLFKIANGPWEKLFSGNFQQHEVELYSNPEKILMILVFEKKLDQIEGAIVELYKVLHATGDVESFTETLPREVLLVTKHDEKQTMKFLLLGSKPSYVKWAENDFIREVDLLVKRLETSASMIKDVSQAYELSLEEIANSSSDVQTAFFTQPMLVPLLATSSHSMGGEKTAVSIEEGIIKGITKGEIVIGLTRDRKKVVEPIALFNKTLVTEGEKVFRNKLLQVFAESALLSNYPAIIFDSGKSFSGIGEASKQAGELQKYEVTIDPLGFPMKRFVLRENVRVDLNNINTDGLAELFGVGEKNFPRILKSAIASYGNEKISSMQDFIEKISGMKQSEEFTEFEILKTARILKLIETIYPGYFGGENSIEEIAKKSGQSIARASIIEFSGIDKRLSLLLTYSLVKGIFEFFKKQGQNTSQIRSFVIMPEAQEVFSNESKKIISKELSLIVKQFPLYGLGFILSSNQMVDLDESVKDDSFAKINIISENDVSVQLKNRKGYRVLFRPTLSKSA